MARPEQNQTWNFSINRSVAAVALAVLFVLTGAAIQSLQAQTLTVLHAFGNQPGDGANPAAGLTLDTAGDLYGTTDGGGLGYGTVFQLKRAGSGYVFRPLYSFEGGNDGASPETGVTIGPNGSLYGTTVQGGGGDNVGTVFSLQPPATSCKSALCPWHETVLLRFNQGNGDRPYGQPIFDQTGNLYGTTNTGGQRDDGEVYELTPSNGGWTENIIYSFIGAGGGYQPVGGVIFDQDGNLYGTARFGGGYGIVYQLVPSGGSWTENAIYRFQGGADQGTPETGLIMDNAGNLYGTTPWFVYGSDANGTVYELSPSGGGWSYTLLYSFPSGYEGAGEVSALAMDKAGNLYGETSQEGIVDGTCPYGCGTVFKLTPSSSGWIYTDLYNFTGGSDGASPYGGVVLDSQGNLYGTSYFGGTGTNCTNGSCGTVWKLTP
jgi:hypothetical protein